MNTTLTFRITEKEKNELKKKAQMYNISLSNLVSQIVSDSLSERDKIDEIIRKILEQIKTLETMLSLNMGYNSEVFATILERSTPDKLCRQPYYQENRNRENAFSTLKEYKKRVGQNIHNGENIWGDIMTIEKNINNK